MPKPQDVTQLCAFLGMVKYYAKFLPDLATHLAPLHRLLQKDVKWSWGAAEEASFRLVKEMLLQDRVLMHYDPDLPLVLATGSSPYGLGVGFSHYTPEGVERLMRPGLCPRQRINIHKSRKKHYLRSGV